MHAIDREPGRLTRGLARIAERPRVVMAVALVATLGAAGVAARLRLRTSLVELLPTRDPAVVSLERTRTRTGDLNLLLVGIRSPDHAANLRYAAALTRHLRSLPPSVCELAASELHDLRDFFQKNRWLYVPESDLEDVRDGLRKAILKKKNPLVIDLSEDGADAPDALVARLQAQASRTGALEQRFPGGDFVRGDFAWVAALPPGGLLVENAGQGLLDAVRAFVAANPPAAFHPEMQVMPAGPVMATLRNREAVEHDIVAVTLACVLVIGLSIALFFRSVRALPLVVAPAALGTLVAFAAAALGFGYLNSSTAFLGSIILGNGINYAIVLLAAFRERRRAGHEPRAALARAVEQVWRSTLAASLAAAAAYASLALTGFRGFSQFGVMGAVGSVACWAATFLVLPALLARFGGAVPARRAPSTREGGLPALVARRPGALLAGALGLTAVAAVGLRHFAHDPFEYDFRKLSTSDEGDAQRRQFEGGVQALFGRWHTPNVLVADRVEQVEPMRAAIRAQDDAARPHVGQIVSVYDVLPGAPDAQRRKLALLRDIRKLASDPGLAALDAATRRKIRENIPPASLAVLGPEALPPLVRRPFTELDGTVGRILLVYHAEDTASLWDGHELQAFAGVLQHLTLADGSVIDSSGPPMVFGAMVRAILHDGPRASLLALLAVVVLVGLVIRPLGAAALAVGTMLVGVAWMIGGAGVAGVRVTFLNFIALPITFGIGVEYAVNVAARLGAEPDPAAAVRGTGSAVALCSWTTIVGYGSLLAAQSQALRGFGAMAILGEVSCLLAAVVGLPAFVSWRRRRAVDARATDRPAAAAVEGAPALLVGARTPVASA
ncbi:MAG TPA: MMPL family transporter [Polyangia bacterium]|nr:MMPL family transporter [Polyangia bacterium]